MPRKALTNLYSWSAAIMGEKDCFFRDWMEVLGGKPSILMEAVVSEPSRDLEDFF